MATNPILTEINGLSPGAKTALLSAHSASAPPDINAGAQPPKIDAGTQQAVARLQAPGAAPGPAMMGAPPMPNPAPNLGAPKLANVTQMSPLQEQTQKDENEHARLEATGSGIHQIKNPVLKGLAGVGNAIGSIAAPGLMRETPGTEEHHNLLLGQNEKNLGNDLGIGQKEAQTRGLNATAAHTEAETPEVAPNAESLRGQQGAETQHLNAETDALKNQQGEWQPVAGWQGPNGEPMEYDKKSGAFRAAPGAQGSTLQRPPEDKAGNDFEQYYKDYLTDNKLPDSAHNRQIARKDWAAASQAPQRAPIVNVLIPDGKGGYVDQGIHPGSTVAAGAVTPSGMNSMNTPTAQTRNMAEMAQTVLPQMKNVSDEVDQMATSLGPAVGRWNQYMVNKGGKDFPQFAKLDTDLDLLASAIVRTHFGARGGQGYREELRKQFGEAQSPEDLKARIAGANQWIEGYAHMADRGGNGGGGGNAPKEGETKINSAGDKIVFKGGKWGPA